MMLDLFFVILLVSVAAIFVGRWILKTVSTKGACGCASSCPLGNSCSVATIDPADPRPQDAHCAYESELWSASTPPSTSSRANRSRIASA